jgi:hypothetical protein
MVFVACAAGAGSYLLARFTDQALADTLGLRTLRHGTDPVTWVKIHLMGGSPQDDKSQLCRIDKALRDYPPFTLCNSPDGYGINFSKIFKQLDKAFEIKQTLSNRVPLMVQTVAITIYRWVFENRFITYVQTEVKAYSPFLYSFCFQSTPLISIFRQCVLHSLTFLQKSMASYQLVKCPKDSGKLWFAAAIAFSTIAALFTPTIKFRYRDSQSNGLFNELPNIAGNVLLISNDHISPLNIGIIGTLKNGVRITLSPLWNQPVKVLSGTAKLALAGAAIYGGAALFPGFIVAHRTALIAGAVFAAL